MVDTVRLSLAAIVAMIVVDCGASNGEGVRVPGV